MAYGVKYRLDYCNIDSEPLRLDILIDGYSGAIFPIEGAEVPFEQSQSNSNKFPKLETVRSTFADLSIYEDDNFNIESLITSDETKIKVNFYHKGGLKWEGYALPEFFQKQISDVNIINITASDRLGILKNISLPIDYDVISFLDLIRRCVIETGVLLNIRTLVGYQSYSDMFLDQPLSSNTVSGQRLFNEDGSSLNAYDVLMSVLDAFGCYITQRDGFWYVINKLQSETGQGNIVEYDLTIGEGAALNITPYSHSVVDLSDVYSGGEEVIQPILSSVSILGEHGGSLTYPSNNNFRLWTGSQFNMWLPFKGFVPQNYSDIPVTYNDNGSVSSSISSDTNKLLNTHDVIYPNNIAQRPHPNSWPYLESLPVDILPLVDPESDINISYSFNVTGKPKQYASFSIIIETNKGDNKFHAFSPTKGWIRCGNDKNNIYNNHEPNSPNIPFFMVAEGHWGIIFQATKNKDSDIEATTVDISGDIVIPNEIINGAEYCKVYVRSLPTMWHNIISDAKANMLVNSVSFSIKNNRKGQRGDLYRADRFGNYTAKANTPVSIFSDHIFRGLNGYFYDYPIDDTSQILGTAKWRTVGDSEWLPILQHTVRQISKLYSEAHTDLVVTIDIKELPINSIFSVSCKNRRYVVTRYTIDYMRQSASLVLSEIKDGGNPDKEYIYSYFGDDGTSVSSLSNVGSSGGSGGGGRQSLQTTTEIGNTTDLDIKVRGTRNTHFATVPPVSPLEEDMESGEVYFWFDQNASPGEDPDPSGDFTISGASDANVEGRTNGQVLSWDASSGKWVARNEQSLIGYATQAWVNSQGFLTQTVGDGRYMRITHPANGITSGNIANWNTAYGWGDFRQFGLGRYGGQNNMSVLSPDIQLSRIFRSTEIGHLGSILSMGYEGSGATARANLLRVYNGNVFVSTSLVSSGQTPSWYTLWHSGNFSQADINKWNVPYLPLSGGTLTGVVNVVNNSKVLGSTNNVSYWSFVKNDATTRMGFVGVGASANNDMYLNADDGNVLINASAGKGVIMNSRTTAPILKATQIQLIPSVAPNTALMQTGEIAIYADFN